MVEPACISYRKTGYFSDLVCDYLDKKESLGDLYNNFPDKEGFKNQIQEKSEAYSEESRKTLIRALKKQYEKVEDTPETQENIKLLADKNTFTVTTGHQLNLFTGPLYFLYKIISAINLAKELKKQFPENNFVPVYWMANEDHDFAEINYFNFKGNKLQWEAQSGGAVGDIPLKNTQKLFESFSGLLDDSDNAQFLKDLFQKAYLEQKNLTDATFYIADKLFGKYGLICIDAHRKELKELFVFHIKNELLHQSVLKNSKASLSALEDSGYKIQVNPREINLFYLDKNSRKRIVKEKDTYYIKDTQLKFSEKEMLDLVENEPERFSPNALMRPLYQECILPNLCYIGGGAEIAYWLELKNYFEAEKIPFPVLLLRNSALLVSEKQAKKLKKLDVPITDLFLKQSELMVRHTKKISKTRIDFSPQKEHLQKQFEDLYKLAEKTDKSFFGAVAAQEKKQLKGLENLEKRLLKAQKRKLKNELERLEEIQNQLFPKHSLQERLDNFSEYYVEYGESLISSLLKKLNPLESGFSIIIL